MPAEVHDITVQILMDIRDEIRTTNTRLETGLAAVRAELTSLREETRAGFKAVHDELTAIDGIVTMLEKRDRETDEEIRKDVRMLKERALRGQ